MEDYYEYLDSNGVTTLYKLIKDDTVALIDSYSVTINGITTNLDSHVNNTDIHTPISDIENMVDTKVSGLVNSAPETLDTLKKLSDALGNDPNFATTVANQIGTKADKDSVYTKQKTDTLLDGKANSVHSHVVSDITDFPTIPTKLSQLENDMGFGSGSGGVITSISWTNITDKPNFATVATSGSYNDLSNKPTIPKVYNKTLTIQKNGTNVATFTSNSNTDVTVDITVPTKVSELSNDSGFITGISWDKVTNKPTLAKVATSGSYTDLSNTPTIPTKVSQLENDTGFINALTDVVDTKSNQTIGGTKKFTSDIVRKYTAVDITTTPTSDMYAHINFTDKNDKSVAYIQYAQKSNGVDYIGLRVRDKNSNTWGVQLNTNKEFVPLGNNSYSLGSSGLKWANVYATTFNGNLKGNADTATRATSADSVAWANVTGRPSIPTTPNAYITATWRSGYNWYRVWSDGWIEQGGRVQLKTDSNMADKITFPKAFSTNQYTAIISDYASPSMPNQGTSGKVEIWGTTGYTTTGMFVMTPASKGRAAHWYACGY